MFGNKKNIEHLDLEQHELFENAQRRIKQKKRLFQHFVLFLLGCLFMFIINKIMGYGQGQPLTQNWFIYGILVWAFLFIYHFVNVFITSPFLGKEWERTQREKLITLQKKKLQKIQDEVEKAHSEKNTNLQQFN